MLQRLEKLKFFCPACVLKVVIVVPGRNFFKFLPEELVVNREKIFFYNFFSHSVVVNKKKIKWISRYLSTCPKTFLNKQIQKTMAKVKKQLQERTIIIFSHVNKLS